MSNFGGFVFSFQTSLLSGSPQSTLCDLGSGSGCSQVSSRGSPKSNCKVPSPPATCDLLHAAAGEVARMRMNESRGVISQNRGTSQVSVPVKNSSTGTGFYQQLQAMQVNILTNPFMAFKLLSNYLVDYDSLLGSYSLAGFAPESEGNYAATKLDCR